MFIRFKSASQDGKENISIIIVALLLLLVTPAMPILPSQLEDVYKYLEARQIDKEPTIFSYNGSRDLAAAEASFIQPVELNENRMTDAGNLFFGIELIGLNSGQDLRYPVSLIYSNANIENIVRENNKKGPTGILGLGWSYPIEKIIVFHNETKRTDDDLWYLIDKSGYYHKIKMNADGAAGHIQGYNNYKISWNMNNDSIISGWKVITDMGIKYYYGDYNIDSDTNACGVIYESGGAINVISSSSKAFFNEWYLKKIEHHNGKHYIGFKYHNRDSADTVTGEPISGTSLIATKSPYLKEIFSNSSKVIFKYYKKESFEYEDPTPFTEPDKFVDKFEKLFLDGIEYYRNDLLFRQFKFGYNNGDSTYLKIPTIDSIESYRKRILTQIARLDKFDNQMEPPIIFDYVDEYDTSITAFGIYAKPHPGFGSLKQIVDQLGKITQLSYSTIEDVYDLYEDKNSADEGNITDLRTNKGDSIPPLSDSELRFIPGTGFLIVVQAISETEDRYNFYSIQDSGFRPISIPGVPDTINKPSYLYSIGNGIVLFKYDSLNTNYDAYVYKYDNYQFDTLFHQNDVKVGTRYLISSSNILIFNPIDTLFGERSVEYRRFDGMSWDDTIEVDSCVPPYVQYFVYGNNVIIKNKLKITGKYLNYVDNSLGWQQSSFNDSQTDTLNNVYDVRMFGKKVALLRSDYEGSFYYDIYSWDGDSYDSTNSFQSFEFLSRGGKLSNKSKVYFSEEWIGIYQRSDTNKIVFTNWDGSLNYWNNYGVTREGYLIGNVFISYEKGAENYDYNFKIFKVRPEIASTSRYLDGHSFADEGSNSKLGIIKDSLTYNASMTYAGNNLIIEDVSLKEDGFESTTNSAYHQPYGKIVFGSLYYDEGTRLTDLNGDNLIDLIRANGSDIDDPRQAYLNTGSGFSEQTDSSYHLPYGFFVDDANKHDDGTRLVDLNGDGLIDIIRGNQQDSDNPYQAYLNTGSGFNNQTDSAYHIPYGYIVTGANYKDDGVRFADLNGDGLIDIIRANEADNDDPYQAFLNNGNGFNTTTDSGYHIPYKYFINSGNGMDWGVRLYDLNGDGLIDVSFSMGGITTDNKKAYINNGSGFNTVTDSNYHLPAGSFGHDLYVNYDGGSRLFDINGDGLLDLADGGSGKIDFYLNNGGGFNTSKDNNYSITNFGIVDGSDCLNEGTAIVDVNGDGLLDIVRSLWDDSETYGWPPAAQEKKKTALINTGSGWTENSDYELNQFITLRRGENEFDFGTRLIDLNNDGYIDQMTSNLNVSVSILNKTNKEKQHYLSHFNKNNYLDNFAREMITEIKEISGPDTIENKYRYEKSYDSDGVSEAFKGLKNYFSLDKRNNQPYNIKTFIKNSSGLINITLRYGDIQEYFDKDSGEVINLKGGINFDNSKRYLLDGNIYQNITFKSDSVIVRQSDVNYKAYVPDSTLNEDYTISIPEQIVNINEHIKTEEIYRYDEKYRLKSNTFISPNSDTSLLNQVEPSMSKLQFYADDNPFEGKDISSMVSTNNIHIPVQEVVFLDSNASGTWWQDTDDIEDGDKWLSISKTIWDDGLGFWAPESLKSPEFKKSVSQNYEFNNNNDNTILRERKYNNQYDQASGNAINTKGDGIKEISTLYNTAGTNIRAVVKNTETELVYIGLFDEYSSQNDTFSQGWETKGIAYWTLHNGGIKCTDPSNNLVLKQKSNRASTFENCIIEFDAYCDSINSDAIVKIRSWTCGAQSDTGIEEFKISIQPENIGKYLHYHRKSHLKGCNVEIEISNGVYMDNFMLYPDTANLTIINYDSLNNTLSRRASGGININYFYDTDGKVMALADKDGASFSYTKINYSRNLSESTSYNPDFPNIIDRTVFINGNLLPYWDFESIGDTASTNKLPYWESFWTSNIEITDTKYFYGRKCLKVTPASDSTDGILVDFIADKNHPQYSALLGKDATFSFWIYPDNAGSKEIRVGLDVTDAGAGNVKTVTGGQWNYVTHTFKDIVSRYKLQSDELSPRIRLFIIENNGTSNTSFYIDAIVLELGTSPNHPNTSTNITDAFGRTIQTHLRRFDNDGDLSDGGDSITVIENTYDSLGRLISRSLPVHFAYYDEGEFYNNTLRTGFEDTLESVYGVNSNPYYTYEYYNDGTSRILRIGSPDSLYGPATDTSKHMVEYQRFACKKILEGTSENIYNPGYAGNFINSDDTLRTDGKFTWAYSISRPYGNQKVYRHNCRNWRGNSILSFSTKGGYSTGNTMTMSKYEYDLVGNLTKEYAPSNFADENDPTKCLNVFREDEGATSQYIYNTYGQLVKKKASDLGNDSIEYRYDISGKLRFVRDPNHGQKQQGNQTACIAYTYDAMDRLSSICDLITTEVLFGDSLNSRIDDPKWPILTDSTVLGLKVLQENEYDSYGRLSATKSYSDVTRMPVISSFIYDYNGNLHQIEEKIPGNKIINTHLYDYTTSGLVIGYRYLRGGVCIIDREMEYDNSGKLLKVTSKNKGDSASIEEMNYEYNNPQALLTKATHPSEYEFTTSNSYDIRGKLKEILTKHNTTDVFKEEMAYERDFALEIGITPQFNGNISGTRFTGIASHSDGFVYSYDSLSRLTFADYYKYGSSGTTEYDAQYAYRVDGNIDSISRIGLGQEAGFEYSGKSHKLTGFSANSDLRGITEGNNRFEYDANGNMIEDKGKKLKIDYDWRNIPILFKFHNDESPPKMIYVVQMLYDASGNRVAKYVFDRTQ